MCGAIVLAAGSSSRFGRPKQLAVLHGETLLERSIRVAKEAGCEPVVVVLGAAEDLIRRECDLHDAVLVSNKDWADGMGTSLARGVGAFHKVPGIVVMTCDMPAVTPDHLRALTSSGSVTASSYAGRKGVPAYFPSAVFPKLLKMSGDTGARELLRTAAGIELAGGELDVDTTEDLTRAMEIQF